MSVDKVLNEAWLNLSEAQAWYTRHSVYERYRLSPIWINNLKHHFGKIFAGLSSLSASQVIQYLHDKAFFDVSVPYPQYPYAVAWFRDLLSRYGVDLRNAEPTLCESDLFSDDRCSTLDGRRISVDFLWRLCIARRMAATIPVARMHPVILEVGSGSGNLARTLKLLHPRVRYVCVDIPESLFFANLFLKLEFPHATHKYVRNPSDVENVQEADFVYVPTEFAPVLASQRFGLFVNTNSLGEMRNEASAHWFQFVESQVEVDHIFLLNRFLNRVDFEQSPHRRDEAGCSLTLGSCWDILDWEIDPDFERSPYVATLFTRNLLVAGTRRADSLSVPAALERLRARVPDWQCQDWFVRPHWVNYRLESGGTYPPLNTRADLNFTHDLKLGGTLFELWEYFRLTRCSEAAQLLRRWMWSHGGEPTPFEEVEYLSPLCG